LEDRAHREEGGREMKLGTAIWNGIEVRILGPNLNSTKQNMWYVQKITAEKGQGIFSVPANKLKKEVKDHE
jgi:hypothetical protein